MVEPVGPGLDALQEFGPVLLGPLDVVGAEGGDGGLDARERGPQVVADGGEQGGADLVALGQLPGLLRLADEPLPVEDDGGLGGEGAEDPPVLGGQHPAGQGERQAVPDRHVGVRLLRPGRRVGADARDGRPRLDLVLALQEGDRLHGEGLADPFEEGVQAGLAAQHAAREVGEHLGLRAQPGGLVGAAGGQVDHRGDRHRDAEEDGEGDDVLGVGDGQAVDGRGEEPVEEERAGGGRGERRQEPAEQRGGHRQGEEEQHVVGEAEVGVDVGEEQGEAGGSRDADRPGGEDPGAAEAGAARDRQAASLGDLAVGDDVDVQVGPGVAGDGLPDAGAEDVLPGPAAAGAEDDLVALTPRANSRSAVGTSSPMTWWNVPPRSSTRVRWTASSFGEAAVSPSLRAM